MSVELEEKKGNIRQLKAQIETLISEKSKILDWVKSKERAVDALSIRENEIIDRINKENSDLDKKKKEVASLLETLNSKQVTLNGIASKAASESGRSDGKLDQLKDLKVELRNHESDLDKRESEIVKKEKFLSQVFKGIEALK